MNRKTIISLVALGVFGLIRMPLESTMTSDFREKGYLEKPLETGALDKVGQTSAVVALGGLRSMVASYFNLKVHNSFQLGRWFDLEEQIKVTTTLQPRSRYFWENGAWHLAYNASAWHYKDTEQPLSIRRVKQREYIRKGLDFLKKGVEMNPQDLRLKEDLARMLSDRLKFPDYAEAARYMRPVAEAPEASELQKRKYLYMIAQIPGRSREAYEMALQLYRSNPENRLNTVNCLILSYQRLLKVPEDQHISAIEMFGTPDRALHAIKIYHNRRDRSFSQHGIDEEIAALRILTGDKNKNGVPFYLQAVEE